MLNKAKYLLDRSGISGQIIALALVIMFFSIGTKGSYLSGTNIKTILTLSGIPIIICLGMSQIIILGAIDLSIEGIIALCGVIAGFLLKNPVTKFSIGFWIIPVILVIGGSAGMANGLVNTRLKMPSFISTLGMWYITLGLAVIIGRGNTVRILDLRFQNLVNGTLFGIPNITIIAFLIFIILQVLHKRTRFGGFIFAIGGDEALAKQAGVKIERTKLIAFAITGSIYGLAALFLVSRLSSANPRIGKDLLFPGMTAVAVGGTALTGGIGGAFNAVMGALIVTAINNGMVLMQINPYIQSAVNGAVLISAVALTIDRKKIGIIK